MKISCKVALVYRGQVLLIHEAPYEGGKNPGKWDLPGGTMRDGESVADCLHREVSEEVGLVLDFSSLNGSEALSAYVDGQTARLVYRFDLDRSLGWPIVLSSDHDAFLFSNLSDLLNHDKVPGDLTVFMPMLDCALKKLV